MTPAAAVGRAGRTAPAPLHRAFVDALRAALGGAHLVLGAGAAWLLSAVPLAAALLAARPELAALALLPLLLATTGLNRALAPLVTGEPFRWRTILAVDPGLAAVAWAATLLVVALPSGGDGGVVASGIVGAALVLVLPLALAYGAVRDRTGLTAVRGGAVLAVVRPDLAATSSALAVLAGFGVVATAGALAPALVPMVILFTARAVAGELARLDGIAAAGAPRTGDSEAR